MAAKLGKHPKRKFCCHFVSPHVAKQKTRAAREVFEKVPADSVDVVRQQWIAKVLTSSGRTTSSSSILCLSLSPLHMCVRPCACVFGCHRKEIVPFRQDLKTIFGSLFVSESTW